MAACADPHEPCAYIDADLCRLEQILRAAAEVIDFTEPVAVVLMAVLQFVPDSDDPHGIVRRLTEAVPSGSYLVISHPAQRVTPRSRERVTEFFDGLELIEPGVIRCPEWRPDSPKDAMGKSPMWGGVARKP